MPARSRSARRPSLQDRWTRRFPDPVSAFASGWMRVRARARQRGVELPLVISDHADWDGLTATIAATGASQIWVTHGAEEALVHWCTLRGLEARPLGDGRIWGRGGGRGRRRAGGRSMNRFAALLDRLAYEPSRNAKLRLLTDYFRTTPDPDRGYALAAITGALSFRHAKPGIIRALIAERTDPMLFELSYDYVGDLSETVALMWPVPPRSRSLPPRSGEGWRRGAPECGCRLRPAPTRPPPLPPPHKGEGNSPRSRQANAPTLTHVVTTLASLGKSELPAQLAAWLDALDETGRWALLKLVTGALRIGVSARLAKTAVAALGDKEPDEVELVWHGARAALRGAVRLDRRPRRKARQRRSGAVPPGDAEPCDRGTGLSRARSRRTSPPNGNGTASACRRSPASRTAGASRGSIRAPARTFPARFPI